MFSERLVGRLDIELHKRPWGLAGQFSVRPAGTQESGRGESSAPLVVGALLVLPAFVALVAGFLSTQVGLPGLFDVISRTPVLSLTVVLSLFLGAPLAVLINLLPIVRLGFKREGNGIKASLAFRPTMIELLVLVIALAVAGVFFGHLLADEFACLRGIKSAC